MFTFIIAVVVYLQFSCCLESSSSLYSELPAHNAQPPVQETTQEFSQNVRYKKPFPLPRTRCQSLPTTKRSGGSVSASPKTTPQPEGAAESDFTGGTGDSGVGSGESDRLAWIKNSGISTYL